MLTRTLILASVIAVPALAGIQMEASDKPVTVPASSSAVFVPEDRLYFTEVDVDALMRAVVVDNRDKVVGSVAELVVSDTGQITDAVVRLTGGLLGVSGDRVKVSFDRLQVEERGGVELKSFVVHAEQSREELKTLPGVADI
ncbi:hypothetical protein [Pseudoruegeria sp. HB172150]|uniref:hypothetical protein n=1 Tax=Pseudoruegeria sp. HB172150 TaxID=2721164 RepID=UPI001555B005|nr:hypothetical protein [Pseudoruegeria sp. HB172150]